MANSSNKNAITGTILIIFLLYGLFSQYLFASIAAGIVFALIIDRLWIPSFPPVLVYAFAYQLFQIFGAVILADFIGTPINNLYSSKDALYLVLVTLAQLGILVYFASKVMDFKQNQTHDTLKSAVQELDTRKVIVGYIICTFFFPIGFRCRLQHTHIVTIGTVLCSS